MKDVAGKFTQGFFVRLLPGVINVGVLLLIGEWLGAAQFGEYSTVVATTGFLASLLFGPLTFSIVPYHARFESEGRREVFESSVILTALAIGVLFIAVGAIAVIAGLMPIAYVAPGAAFGLYTIALEILRARVKLWSYGLASLVQSAVLLAGAMLYVSHARDASAALNTFTFSYTFAFIVAIILNGGIKLMRPNLSLLRNSVSQGGQYTVAVFLENALTLGLRYMVLYLGSPQLLGAFSFGLDLAQRIVGVFANITSFAVVPAAFKLHGSDKQKFEEILRHGGLFSAGVCLLALVSTILLSNFDWIPGLGSALFKPATFAIISVGVIINRVKKITIDQIAMRDGNAIAISRGLIIAVPSSLLLAWVCHKFTPAFAEIAYLIAYIVASAVMVYARRSGNRVSFTS